MATHNQCMNFTNVDVFKGYCRTQQGFVLIDSPTCPAFNEAPRCGNCAGFSNADQDNIGTCKGLAKEYWAYADMNAGLCEGYAQAE